MVLADQVIQNIPSMYRHNNLTFLTFLNNSLLYYYFFIFKVNNIGYQMVVRWLYMVTLLI